MIRAAITAGCLVLAGCATTPATPTVRIACPAGEVIVHGHDLPPCDLRGDVNTLTVLDITPAECDDIGGAWVYEACNDTDF